MINFIKLIQRREAMIKQRAAGKTLAEIGLRYGLTRQRVDQILNHPYIVRPKVITLTASEKYYIRKNLVLTHYGNGKPACVLCGFSDLRALTIDPISENGLKRKNPPHISDIYKWVIGHNYPNGFRTLCINCQWITKNETHPSKIF